MDNSKNGTLKVPHKLFREEGVGKHLILNFCSIIFKRQKKKRLKRTLILKSNYALLDSNPLLCYSFFLAVEIIKATKILDLFPPVLFFFSDFCGLSRILKLHFEVNNSASSESHNKNLGLRAKSKFSG